MVATCRTELDIFNMAALALGAKRSISTNDKTNIAEEMQAAFRLVRDNLIRSYNWDCCQKEDTLALKEVKDGERLAYVYQVPSDCLQIISLNGIQTGYSGVERVEFYDPLYKIRGHNLFTKLKAPLKVEYSYRNEDITSYDACFCKVLALDLAIAVCDRATNSDSKKESLKRDRREAINDALRSNALEIPARPKITGNWLKSRQRQNDLLLVKNAEF
ncbi:MAG: hypothetical protein IJ532_08175 [Alphaproteobacteria bacterium]|nr:hypothetical protein [Alphaproteobacteria bacterium]MBQ8482492.1 hypothetical protein [Alphaproteobacteria bacterium]